MKKILLIALMLGVFAEAKGILEDEFKNIEISGELLYRYDHQSTKSKELERSPKKSKGNLNISVPLN